MESYLSKGDLGNLLSGRSVESPVFQVVNFKVLQSGDHQRFRMLVSDGQHSTASCMLATQLNEMVNKDLQPFALFRVDRFVCNTVNGSKKVLIVLDLSVVHSGVSVGCLLGSPVSWDFNRTYEENLAAVGSSNGEAQENTNSSNRVPLEPMSTNQQSMAKSFGASPARPSASMPGIHPIASLTPYQNKWTICARVTSKSSIRTWSNSRGEGKLFSMDLLDESGEIKATAFKEQCDKFYNMIEPNHVYYITGAQLKPANKQYSSLKNDYEMTFNQATQMTPCEDKTSIPAMQFQFVTIDQLERAEKDSTIDVIGVCKECNEISTVKTKATGQELKKRDLQIVDDTSNEVRLTLWGSLAESFDGSLNPIVAVKGAKVSEFNGRSLSVLASSTVQINPDIKESHKLRAWFENVGNKLQTTNLSNQRAGGGVGVNDSLKTIGEATLENLGCNDQADYYSTKATPILIRKENCLYTACPSEGCNKKVVDMNNGVFRCEKCNREYDSFNWRFMLNMNIADATENVWAATFQDQAEAVLGCSSADLGMLRESDETAFHAVFDKAAFKEFIFKFRVKMDTYNDERRLRTSVVSAQPLDCREYNKRLIQQIKSMSGTS